MHERPSIGLTVSKMDQISGLSIIKAYGSEESEDSEDEDVVTVAEAPRKHRCHHQPAIPLKKPKLFHFESEETCLRNSTKNGARLSHSEEPGEGKIGHDVAKIKSVPVLPSVPKNILEMFPETIGNTPKDDPSEHMGRVRSFPHIRGNWSSYVYIFFPEDAPVIFEVNKLIRETAKSLSQLDGLYSIDEKHLSLSRTLPFRHHWIEPFVSNLKTASNQCTSFDLYFDEFDVYTNDEKSRTFISMNVISSINLLELVGKCDLCLADFQLDPYYKDPSFHISCAWMLGDKKIWAEQNLLPILNKKWNETLKSDPEIQRFNVSSLEFKTGNKLFRFYLKNLCR